MEPRPILLEGLHVRLEPLTLAHAAELLDALCRDLVAWQWFTTEPPQTLPEMQAYVAQRLAGQDAGKEVCFAQVSRAEERVVGMTTYLDLRLHDRGLEIGGTWIGRPWQRTAINTEAKFLLLRHAFEDLGALRVQLKTDERNHQSQAAIARLGAVREGVLRRYQLTRGGVQRNTVMFSVTAEEWDAVKVGLEARLRARA